MRRAGRILFTILSSLSLLLCIATCVLWVRSYWQRDIWAISQDYNISAETEPGLIRIHVFRNEPGTPHTWWYHSSMPQVAFNGFLPSNDWWNRFGFGHYVDALANGTRWDRIIVPHYSFAFGFGLLPLIFGIRVYRTRRRRAAGSCPMCGYDLRATPDRCPECGHVPDVVSHPSAA